MTAVPGLSGAHAGVGYRERGIRLVYIQPGEPQQNAYVERFNRTVRHEYLGINEFRTVEEARQLRSPLKMGCYSNGRF